MTRITLLGLPSFSRALLGTVRRNRPQVLHAACGEAGRARAFGRPGVLIFRGVGGRLPAQWLGMAASRVSRSTQKEVGLILEPMLTRQLDAFWLRAVGDAPPIPSSLKDVCRSRWVRFHSLPNGKRYATSPAETEEVLRRHNTVVDQIAQCAPHVFVITPGYSDGASAAQRDPVLRVLDPAALPWRALLMQQMVDDLSDPSYMHLFASAWTWRPGLFDDLLRMVADDAVADVMLVFDAAGCIYHPYDGGADVVLSTTDWRDEIKAKFRGWLSAHEDGL